MSINTDHIRFAFHTQLPRGDGCGVRALQMLTGQTYDHLASLVDWGDRSVHYMRWADITGVLDSLGVDYERPRPAGTWGEIEGIAIVHVEGDHFVFYDGAYALVYDPGEASGPTTSTRHVPMSALAIRVPAGSGLKS